MVMQYLERELRGTGDPRDLGRAETVASWLKERGSDIPLSSIAAPVEKQAVKTPEADSIVLAIAEYEAKSLTPEIVNKTWQTLWKVWGETVGQKFDVPSCDRTSEELAQLQKENKAVLLIPGNVDLVTLGRIFPQMVSWAVSEGTIIAEQSKGGSIDIEMDLNSPHRDTTEAQARDLLKSQGRDGQRLKTYIVGSQFSKLLTGHYFDENSWSRLPGSRVGGRLVHARCYSVGNLNVNSDLNPRDRRPSVGFRSEGAIQSVHLRGGLA